MTPDPNQFRRVMGLFATGVTVVTTQDGRERHGMTANAFCSVSLDPLMLLVSLHKEARMLHLLRRTGGFAVNLLNSDQEAVSRHFSGARGHSEPEFRFERWEGGPRLVGCLGAAGCSVENLVEAGDHVLVLGRVQALYQGESGHAPLLFWGGKYRRMLEWNPVPVEPRDTFDRASERIFYGDGIGDGGELQ